MEERSTQPVLKDPSNQIGFFISYRTRKLPSKPTTPLKTARIHLSSTIDFLQNSPIKARVNLSQELSLLGIDSRHHAGLINPIMRNLQKVLSSGTGPPYRCLHFEVLNIKIYDSVKTVEGEVEDRCSICLEEIDKYGARTRCGHVFHGDCITEWLDKRNSCPLCRSGMRRVSFTLAPEMEKLTLENLCLEVQSLVL